MSTLALTIRIPPRTQEEIEDERKDIIRPFMRDNDMCTRHYNIVYGLLNMSGYSFEEAIESFGELSNIEQQLVIDCICLVHECEK